jgi:hypothetical protein
VRIIKDNSFWLKLEAAIAVLKPVNEFQHVSEADEAGIAHVVDRWLQIKSKWSEMERLISFLIFRGTTLTLYSKPGSISKRTIYIGSPMPSGQISQ